MIVFLQGRDQLQTNGRLPRTLFAKHDRCTGIAAIAKHFVPCRMMNCFRAMLLEDMVRLRIFLAEWIDVHSVVFEELLNLHLL